MHGRNRMSMASGSPVLLAIMIVAGVGLLTGCKQPVGPTTTSSSSTTTVAPLVTMVSVPGGSFEMGNASYAAPVHTVNVTGFLMSTYEVTQEQYQTVTGQTPSHFSGTDLPVERVTWFDAVEFCNKFSEQEDLESVYTITNRTPATGYPITSADVTMDITRNGYRLPTEAEWEYAVRGGNGSPDNHSYAGSDTVGAVAWYEDNSGGVSHRVGTKAQNSLGLYDMSGNVWEWCWDWIADYPASVPDDPTGPASGTIRITRGGCWSLNNTFCHTDTRFSHYPFDRFDTNGFRIVRRP